MMAAELPTVLITPKAKAALEAEAERAGIGGDIMGGLLFGYPLDERRRLIVGSVRPRPEVGFGQKDFCLDQSRTSQQLEEARKLAPEADYCGVWYVHHTPTGELTDKEWVQAQSVLEDPDYAFKDLVCLVICLYAGELNTYALSFNLHHSARGQLPAPTVLRLTTESPPTPAQASPTRQPTPPPDLTDWYKSPDVVRRLELERERLAQRYRVESAIAPDGKVVFRLMPKHEHEDMVFYMVCRPGFPEKPPTAFLSVRGDRYPLLSPGLNEWSAEQRLVDVADDLVEWQVGLLDQQIATAEQALHRGDYQKASDLLAMVLLIDPRKPQALRLLARAPALLKTTESPLTQASPTGLPASPPAPTDWYKSPEVASRLEQEHERLVEKYRVEPSLAPDGKVVFRLMPEHEHQDIVFYVACGPGFPDEPPAAFLSVRGDRYPLLSPGLNEWSAEHWLVEMADDLVEWQVGLLDQQMAAAEEALNRGDYQEASDLLAMVLLIDPRKPRAARLLARAESLLEATANE
ncbi:MAG: hypothetical protein ACE5OS_03255 [Anaerolineae bacterium]